MIINASDMQGFTLEISDREIYNDIRAECDITEILTLRPDATPEFFDTYRAQGSYRYLDPGASVEVTVYPRESDHIFITWLEISEWSSTPICQRGWSQAQCEALGGDWIIGPWGNPNGPSMCHLPASLGKAWYEIVDRSANSCTVAIESRSDYRIGMLFYVEYLALTPEKRYIKLRSTDETSIAKYGRRVMDLIWPLGQHPNTMQSILDSYCTRYSEPVSMAQMTLEGSTDAKITTLLSLHVDGKHQIIHPRLDMDQNFFINNLNVSFQREGDGILRGMFDLEQTRASEELTIFTLDVSELDGAHVLG